jgi:tetratricopeptide (TPR) repeat protein
MTKRFLSILTLLLIMLFAVPLISAQDDAEEEEEWLVCPGFEEKSTDIRIGYYMGEGAAFMQTSEYASAIYSYSCIIQQIADDYLPAYTNRAVIHTIRRSYDLAIEDYTTILAINPNYLAAYNNRGIVYAARDEYEEAMADFNSVIGLDADYTLAYFNRGLIYAAQGEYDLAVADFEHVIALGDLEMIVDIFETAEEDNTRVDRDELPEYELLYARAYAMLGLVHSHEALDDYQRYLWLTGSRTNNRIESAAGSLSSRFNFELRFDDGTWMLVASFDD